MSFETVLREITFDGLDMYSRVVDAEYPNYARAIPTGEGYQVVFNKAELASVIGLVNKLPYDGQRGNAGVIAILVCLDMN